VKVIKSVLFSALLSLCFEADAADLSYRTELVSTTEANGGLDVSVYAGEAGWSGNMNGTIVAGTFGEGTVLDYAFFNDTFGTLEAYAEGAESRIGEASFKNISSAGVTTLSDVWTSMDPNTGNGEFSTTPDFRNVETVARVQDGGGTIDVSGLASGTVYLIYGTFINTNQVAATLSGAGQDDIHVVAEGVGGEKQMGSHAGLWITRFDFTTDNGAYTNVLYKYTNEDMDASRARFMGVVVVGTAIHTSGTIGLFGFGALLVLLLRKKV
jgi:hypothetical protein